MAEVRLESVRKRFGTVVAVDEITLHIAEGELLALLGPSGCGKTTTLRCIGGFTDPDQGEIYFGTRRVTHLLPEQRNIGMVFQNYALFPHMTVYNNVAFGLRMRRAPARVVEQKVAAILSRVQLTGFESRYPRQLSGGQQQRVALARALVSEPEVLLLDEPLANLDAKLREEMRFYIRGLQKDVGITTIYVTHDQAEAMVIADRIAVMFQGLLQQLGLPKEVYRSPANRAVADFIGLTNFIPGRIARVEGPIGFVQTAVGQLMCVARPEIVDGAEIVLAVRPEHIHINHSSPASQHDNILNGTIEAEAFVGNLYDYRIKVADGLIMRVQETVERSLSIGERVQLRFAAKHAWAVD